MLWGWTLIGWPKHNTFTKKRKKVYPCVYIIIFSSSATRLSMTSCDVS